MEGGRDKWMEGGINGWRDGWRDGLHHTLIRWGSSCDTVTATSGPA